MSRTSLLAFAGFLLCAVLAFLFWQDLGAAWAGPHDGDRPEGTQGSGRDRDETDVGETGASDRSSPGTRARTSLATEGAGDAGAGDDSILVTVVERKSGKVLPDAEVIYPKWGEPVDFAAFRELGADSEAYHRRFGHLARTDASGQARIRRPRVGPSAFCRIMGRHGALFGTATFEAQAIDEDDSVQLALSPDLTVRVRVLDDARKPAPAVEVLVRARHRSHENPNELAEYWTDTSVTGPEGSATFPHVHTWAVSMEDEGEKDVQIDVSCRIPGYCPPAVVVLRPEGSVRRESVEFQLPPTGELAVQLVDSNSCPRRGEGDLEVLPRDAPDEQVYRARSTPAGNWRFPRVALGIQYGLEATVGHVEITTAIQGPTRRGDRVEAELRLPEDQVILTGTARGAKGEILRDARIHIAYTTGESKGSNRARTDERGRFHFLLGGFVRGKTLREARLLLLDSSRRPTGLTAKLALATELTPGDHDLGDVRFAKAPLVVDGVLIGREPGVRDFNLLVENFDASRLPEHRWQRDRGVTMTFPSADRFEVRGHPAGSRLRLTFASFAAYQPVEPREFTLGERSVRIELARAASLKATVDVGTAIPDGAIQLQLRPAIGEPGYRPFRPGSPERTFSRDSSFGVLFAREQHRSTYFWGGRRPGVCDLLVFATGSGTPIHEVRGIRLVAGRQTDDKRLDPIDLRDKARMLSVTVVDASGEPVRAAEGGVFVLREDTNRPLEGRQVNGEPVAFLVTETAIDLLVVIPGFVEQRVRGVTADRRIVLQRHPQVDSTIQITGDLPVLPAGVFYVVWCGPVPEAGSTTARAYHARRDGPGRAGTLADLRQPACRDGRVDPNGRVTFTLRRGSKYHAVVLLRQGETMLAVERPRPVTFEAKAGLRVELAVTAEAVRKTLAALK